MFVGSRSSGNYDAVSFHNRNFKHLSKLLLYILRKVAEYYHPHREVIIIIIMLISVQIDKKQIGSIC
jgi:hypothetical protein